MTKERFPRAQEDGHRAHQVSGCRGGNQGTRSPAVFRNPARLLLLEYQDEGRAKKQEWGQLAPATTFRVPGWV